MKPDYQTLLAWTLTVLLIGASIIGAWLVTGKNIDGLLSLLHGLELQSRHEPVSTALGFAIIFALTTALTLPTATLLCVIAGYLFGMYTGSIVSLAGALGGAMITFVTVRSMARERVRNFLLRGRTYRMIRLLERNAFFYLVAFRIIPVAPFFAINAAGAMIRITAGRYLLATTLGLIPIIMIYVSVGAGLETLVQTRQVSGPEILLHPKILLPLLALIAILVAGLLTRTAVRRRRRRRQA